MSTDNHAPRLPTPHRGSYTPSIHVAPSAHQVENESPPETVPNLPEVKHALASARILISRVSAVLGSSSLHQEEGSSIQNLYVQALRLSDFQLPLSRIVGLIGDSGVGKSSLINSLLDKPNLARAVGELNAHLATIS
jgi:ABC-type glutathione transport system ATPase component